MIAATLPLVESTNVLHAKLMALRFSLQLSISCGLSPAMVYSDAHMVIYLVISSSLLACELGVVLLNLWSFVNRWVFVLFILCPGIVIW